MTDKQLSGAIVFPEDRGTGVGSDVDHASAGHFGLHAQNQDDSAYVAQGLDFTNVDAANDTANIDTGFAFVALDNVDVQTGSDDSYDTTLPSAAVMTIILSSAVSLDLDVDAVNDIYLAHDPTTNDEVYVRFGSSVSAPSDPSVKLGTVDTSDGSTTRASDFASPRYNALTVEQNVETLNGTLEHNRVSVSSNTTTSGDGYYSVDTSGGTVTVTLASADAVDGLEINVKRNGANDVTIDTEGTETVEDGSSYTLSADNESATLVYNSNTTDWEVF